MTVTSSTARNDYTVAVIRASYPYTFKILDEDDLEVIVRAAADGTETTLTRGVDYNVTGAGLSAGGTVALTEAAPAGDGDHLTIRRVPSFTQQTDIRNQGRYAPELHEDAFDRFVMMAQYLRDIFDAAMRLPTTVSPDDVSVYLPVPEANKYLAWSNDGSAIVNKATTDGGITETAADVRYGLRVEPVTDLGNMGSAKTITRTAAKNRFSGTLDNAACAVALDGIPDSGYMELHLKTGTTGCAVTWSAPAGQTITHMSGGGTTPTLPAEADKRVSFVVERIGTELLVYQTGANA